MYYAIYCHDHENSMEKRRSVREAHLARLKELDAQNRLLVAGPLLEQDKDEDLAHGVKGSLIVAKFDDLETAKVWAAADPYVTAEVYKQVSITPFKVVFPND